MPTVGNVRYVTTSSDQFEVCVMILGVMRVGVRLSTCAARELCARHRSARRQRHLDVEVPTTLCLIRVLC